MGHKIISNEWWKDFFDEHYIKLYNDKLFTERTQKEVTFLKDIFIQNNKSSKILDLACGQGRHAVGLAVLGYDVTGLDYSNNLLALARLRAEVHKVSVHLVQGDMRSLPFKNTEFDGAVSMFSSFGYFENEEDNERVIAEVARVLKKEGVFVLDLRSINSLQRHPSNTSTEVNSIGIEIQSRTFFNIHTKYWDVVMTWKQGDTKGEKVYRMRIYTKKEIVKLLMQQGLVVKKIFGSFTGTPYTNKSNRMIIVAKKQ